ncbi:MAG TPA: LamG-like jellyroll fold domain-containing protein [Chitinivibrionales bacterium]|nr:LamG-like jellyroll fold domain-containing protein [Chitinivibrionales bacterium]
MLRRKLAALFLLSGMLYTASAGFLEADGNTVALWRFDEGQGTIVHDCSANHNDGIIYGAQWCDGLYGIALAFNGIDNYVSVPHSASLVSPSGAITLEAFVFVDSYNALSSWSHVLDKPHTYALSFDDGTPAFAACGVGNECWWTPESYSAPTGKWLHVAAQFDGQKRQIFVNDSLVAESLATGSIEHLSDYPVSDLVIGAGNLLSLRVGATGYFFHGKIDEVRISNIARYGKRCGYFTPDAHTIALYHFDEGEGSIVHDASGNSNDGTIIGAQWVDGRFCKALSFNGVNTYVSVPHSASLVSATKAITLEAFVKIFGFNQLSEWSHVLDKPHTYAMSFNNGTPAFAACGVGTECWWMPGNFMAPIEKWIHVAVQFDGCERHIYVDDSLVARIAATGTIAHLDGYPLSDLVIGAGNLLSLRQGATGYFFNGLIDEVRISDIARYGDVPTNIKNPKSESAARGLIVVKGSQILYVPKIETNGPVFLDIYNCSGKAIRSISCGNHGGGTIAFVWDGKDVSGRLVPSGPYVYRIRIDGCRISTLGILAR